MNTPKTLHFWLFLATLSAWGCTGRFVGKTSEVPFARTDARVERGGYLVNQVMGCGVCHTQRPSGSIYDTEGTEQYLGGGNVYEDLYFDASVGIPNITPDAETGIGTWSDEEILRAIRDGVRADGSFISPWMPYTGYQHLSDQDGQSIVAYLRTIPPVKQERPRHANRFPFITRMVLKLGMTRHKPAKDVPHPDERDSNAYGEYLVHIAHCGDCHSMTTNGPYDTSDDRFMAGARVPTLVPGIGKVWARNLSPDPETGLGRFSADQIKEALRTGRRLDGTLMAPPMATFLPHYSGMTDHDLDTIIKYLRDRPPVRHEVPERVLTPEGRAYLQLPAL